VTSALRVRLALFALVLGGCAQATELVLVIDTDLEVPGELSRVEIDVTNSMAVPTRTAVDLTSGSAPPLPLTLGITSRRGDADVRIEVRGYLESGEILVRDVATRLTPGRSRLLRVLLVRRCLSLRCGVAETCAETGCRSVDVDPAELPDWGGAPPALDGACAEVEETCNLVDDDCDDAIDEGVMLETDPANCGRCGRACGGACVGGYCAGERPVEVVAGGAHTCVRRENGAIACFGWNAEGQLGTSRLDRSSVPLDVPELAGVRALAAGGAFGCAIDARGALSCVGDGDDGALGRGDRLDGLSYARVMDAGAYERLAAGTRHACAAGGGVVACWGDRERGAAGMSGALRPSPIAGLMGATALGAGDEHSCAVASGAVLCWGSNAAGQLGRDPGMVASTETAAAVPGLDGVTALALGRDFSCALRMGEVLCWGDNTFGQLGATGVTASFAPLAVEGIADAVAISAAAGGLHACALRAGGRVSCWGANLSGQLGDGTTDSAAMPVEVRGVTGAVSVAAGGLSGDGRGHTCVVLGDGEVRCAGDGTLGQTGDAGLAATRTSMAAVPGLP
jgi:alpha-tubulin suppressor-like RCC1 family protein